MTIWNTRGMSSIQSNPNIDRYKWPWLSGIHKKIDFCGTDDTWPMISIIIPSFNQGEYIEETIRSVILQDYPKYELYVIDGGSTDNTLEIIKRYESYITYWVSEKDDGQSDAINKGFDMSRGEIVNWLCSDDILAEGALFEIASAFKKFDDVDVVAGSCMFLYSKNPNFNCVKTPTVSSYFIRPYACNLWQPSFFVRKSSVQRNYFVKRDMHYCMDRELICFLHSGSRKILITNKVISYYRFTGINKSVQGGIKIIKEINSIYKYYNKSVVPYSDCLIFLWMPCMVRYKQRSSVFHRAYQIASKVISLTLKILVEKKHINTLQKEIHMYSIYHDQN